LAGTLLIAEKIVQTAAQAEIQPLWETSNRPLNSKYIVSGFFKDPFVKKTTA